MGGGGYLYNFLLILFFVSELWVSDGLRSVGGVQVASKWLMQTLLGLFVLASRWLARSQWVVYVNSIGFICWAAPALKRAAPKVCVFSCWEELRFRGELVT